MFTELFLQIHSSETNNAKKQNTYIHKFVSRNDISHKMTERQI